MKWDFKLIGQWVLIVAAGFGMYIAQDRRITALEAGWIEERNGYVIMTKNLANRLDRIEDKLDRLVERRLN